MFGHDTGRSIVISPVKQPEEKAVVMSVPARNKETQFSTDCSTCLFRFTAFGWSVT